MWWTLTASDKEHSNDEFVGQEVATVLSEDTLAFLRQFQSIIEIAEFLEKIAASDDPGFFPLDSAQRYCYSAILYSMCGEGTRIDSLMARAIEESAGTPIGDIVLGAKDRIS